MYALNAKYHLHCPTSLHNQVRHLKLNQKEKDLLLKATYQARFSWTKMLVQFQDLSSPEKWGWHGDGNGWIPVWTKLPEACKSCQY